MWGARELFKAPEAGFASEHVAGPQPRTLGAR
jgi:hypothetical protein